MSLGLLARCLVVHAWMYHPVTRTCFLPLCFDLSAMLWLSVLWLYIHIIALWCHAQPTVLNKCSALDCWEEVLFVARSMGLLMMWCPAAVAGLLFDLFQVRPCWVQMTCSQVPIGCCTLTVWSYFLQFLCLCHLL